MFSALPKEEVVQVVSPKSETLLEVRDLSVSFLQYTGGLRQRTLRVITNFNVNVMGGEVVAVVGSSGSGKSLLAHAVLGILPKNATVAGSIEFAGERLSLERQKALRGNAMTFVPQSLNFLDPLMKVGDQVRSGLPRGGAARAQKEVFSRYRLAPDIGSLYPFQLSGGMARRVLVSTAVVSDARLIIADEPTPGLDSVIVKEALGHLRQLADEGRGVLLITHDIENALEVADRIAVFYAGTTVEVAPAGDFSGTGEALRHPYSRALWRAMPQNGFVPIPGSQPLPNDLPAGCLFAPRCPHFTAECAVTEPQAREMRGGMVRCINAS